MRDNIYGLDIERIAEDAYYEKIMPEEIDVNDLPYLCEDMYQRTIKEINFKKCPKILDLGAGSGILSVIMALRGANVIALDISKKACEIIESLKLRYDVVDKIEVINGTIDDVKNLSKMDYVVSLNSLHHMQIDRSMRIIYSLLKEGGKALFVEPLFYNPLAYLYRKISKSESRTEAEEPLKIKDLKTIKKDFSNVKFKGLYLLSSVLLSFERMFKTRERSAISRSLFHFIRPFDEIFSNIPLLKYLSWKIMVIAEK